MPDSRSSARRTRETPARMPRRTACLPLHGTPRENARSISHRPRPGCHRSRIISGRAREITSVSGREVWKGASPQIDPVEGGQSGFLEERIRLPEDGHGNERQKRQHTSQSGENGLSPPQAGEAFRQFTARIEVKPAQPCGCWNTREMATTAPRNPNVCIAMSRWELSRFGSTARTG